MARPRLAALASGTDRPWENDPRVVRLTDQIRTLQGKAATAVVRAIVQIGDRLQQIQRRLSHGQWRRWCASEVPWSTSTIANYIALSQWAAQQPGELERLQHLGPSKLYLLMPLASAQRRRLTGAAALAIPGRAGKKTIDVMTVGELARVIGDDLATPPVPRAPIDQLVQGVRHKIAGLDASTDLLIARKSEVDPDAAAQLHAALVELADELAEAFSL